MTDANIVDAAQIEELSANLRDSADRMKYTYKAHEKAADRYDLYEKWRHVALIVFTVLSASTLIVSIFALVGHEAWGNLAVAIVATCASLASLLGDYLDFAGKSQRHQMAAVKTRALFVGYEDLIGDLRTGAVTPATARKRRDQMRAEENAVLADIARTTRKDYDRASKAIETDEKTSEAQDALHAASSGGAA
ncbi:SLATT domain-containing protein [Gordonibacter sp. Marseille-P4307]|uniref:SLATT domain-containing protein n=1 Tax=Gordonibacter sp. Marseille-P4307 TaxID=2161815 RepID=UPI000F54B3AC|nr:SLATT domain-containing protein [Gordonibacter sp. Marseille-P4307]